MVIMDHCRKLQKQLTKSIRGRLNAEQLERLDAILKEMDPAPRFDDLMHQLHLSSDMHYTTFAQPLA